MRWTWNDQAWVYDLAAAGWSSTKIARFIGKPRGAVCGWCRRNGVTLGARGVLDAR